MKRWGTPWIAALLIHAALGAVLFVLAGRARRPDEQLANAPIEIETIVTPQPAERTETPGGDHRQASVPAIRHGRSGAAVQAPARAPSRTVEPTPAADDAVVAPLGPPASQPTQGVDLQLRADPFGDSARTAVATAAPAKVDLRLHAPGPAEPPAGERPKPKSFSAGSDLLSMGDLVKSWAKNPEEHARNRDGTVQLFHATVDATDIFMRAHGQDPYRQEKARALDATREQRLAAAIRERRDRQREALAALPATLRRIWNDQAQPPRQRREQIFELWDECDESPSEDDESPGGVRARSLIAGFIRAELAANTAGAYPADELASLNAHRQSRQRFDPYGQIASPMVR